MKPIRALIDRVFFSEDYADLRKTDFQSLFKGDQKESTLLGALAIYLFSQEDENREAAENFLNSMDDDIVKNIAFLKGLSDKELGDDKGVNDILCDIVLKEQQSRVYELQDRLVSLRSVFCNSGALYKEDYDDTIKKLREKRTLHDCVAAQDPITDAGSEVLFTSNGLLTVPSPQMSLEEITKDHQMQKVLEESLSEDQQFWYDHPIQIGTPEEANEILYGLKNLNESLTLEKERGAMEKDQRADVVISMSVTHPSLQKIAGTYLREELLKMDELSNINIFGFTESDAVKLINEIFIPMAQKFFPERDYSGLREVFGVDGEYGRHYSFLKAIAPLWKGVINEKTKATFKIDLDQVFPQEDLIRETGKSAFELLSFPLWGGYGYDSDDNKVEMGMIAGALVNENDIAKGLFTPDVPLAPIEQEADGIFFPTIIPQALSTEAEMMTQYNNEPLNGIDTALQRIHVTGGTNGIRVDSLLKYRPFTPSFIGRAEDQCYILSILHHSDNDSYLRYVHRDGLFMRHDKENFAQEAIKAAKTGKIVGDYIRMIYFTRYAHALPYDFSELRDELLPFTGSFITDIPVTLNVMRLIMKSAYLYENGEPEESMKLLDLGSERLKETLEDEKNSIEGIAEAFQKEKNAWDLYYDIMEKLLEETDDEDVVKWKERAKEIIEACNVS